LAPQSSNVDQNVEARRSEHRYKDLEDLAPIFSDQDGLAVRFYALRANCGACDVLCERILGAEGVGAAHMAAWPRLDEPEIGANRRVIVDPDEAFVPPRSVEEEVKGLARPMTRSERRRIEAEAAQPEPEPSAPPPPVELMVRPRAGASFRGRVDAGRRRFVFGASAARTRVRRFSRRRRLALGS